MTYIKINDTLYPATIAGRISDSEWDKRESKAITLEMDYDTAMETFVDGAAWSIVQDIEEASMDDAGNIVTTVIGQDEFDNSDFCVAGDVTDHRDGTVTVKMGKLTELEEAYIMILGGI